MNYNLGLPNLPGVPDLGKLIGDYEQLELGDIRSYTFDPEQVPKGKRAILYLRVSDPSQLKTSRDPFGQSIPAQRTSCLSRAEELGLTVIDEYVEPGRSATELTKRIAFRQLLARLQTEGDVGVVIVYKFSRAARNQWEDAILGVALASLGVKLISATEPIDESAAGKAMRGMISVFNEYSSNASGEDIKYKMGEKARNGGTLGRARLGYTNVRDITAGRDIRSVSVDEERAPFVKLAFELYATGEYTLTDIVDELTDRGLTTRPTAKNPAGPVSVNKIHQMLQDRYYIGYITYKGEEFPGQHDPLIDKDLFDKVQGIIRSRGHSGERRRVNNHYLKGSVFCGACDRNHGINRRLVIQRAVGRAGGEYFYFYCPGTKDGTCTTRHYNLFHVEEVVEQHYKTRRFDPAFVATMREMMTATLDDQNEAQRLLRHQLDEQLAALNVREENLLNLAADGSMPQAKIKTRLLDIEHERTRLIEQLGSVELDLSSGFRYIDANLQLLENPQDLYRGASDEVRRRLNQAIFAALYIEDEKVVRDALNEPLDELFATEAGYRAGTIDPGSEAINSVYTAAFAAAQPRKDKAAQTGGLILQQHATTTWAQLITAFYLDGGSYKPPMVEMGGIEPPSTAVILRLLRAYLVKAFYSALTFATSS